MVRSTRELYRGRSRRGVDFNDSVSYCTMVGLNACGSNAYEMGRGTLSDPYTMTGTYLENGHTLLQTKALLKVKH